MSGGVPVNVPLSGPLTMVNDSGSPSTSEPVNVMPTPVSSDVVTLWPLATGASFTAVTAMLTVATPESAVPSLAMYVKLSVPLNTASGVYSNEPSRFSVSVPCIGPSTINAVSGSLSVSVSLTNTPGAGTLSGTSSSVLYASSLATGASLAAN